ncbi:hypothetical protein YC2023_072313 [Brassica napus]
MKHHSRFRISPNPGTKSVKENATKQPAFANPETVFVRKQCCNVKSKTTLGNGYLGSRIDEERSKMRYLGTSAWVSQIVVPPSSRGYGTEADLPCVTARVRRSGPKALDDPKSSTRPQSGEASSATDRAQVPWKGAPERVRAPSCPDPVAPRGAVYESGCLGMQPQSGGKFRPRLNMGERPIANKYHEVKMKRTLKRESKSASNCREGSGWGPAMRPGRMRNGAIRSADRFGAWTDAD